MAILAVAALLPVLLRQVPAYARLSGKIDSWCETSDECRSDGLTLRCEHNRCKLAYGQACLWDADCGAPHSCVAIAGFGSYCGDAGRVNCFRHGSERELECALAG